MSKLKSENCECDLCSLSQLLSKVNETVYSNIDFMLYCPAQLKPDLLYTDFCSHCIYDCYLYSYFFHLFFYFSFFTHQFSAWCLYFINVCLYCLTVCVFMSAVNCMIQMKGTVYASFFTDLLVGDQTTSYLKSMEIAPQETLP